MNTHQFMQEYQRITQFERHAKIESAKFQKNNKGKLFEIKNGSVFTLIHFSLSNLEPFKPYTIALVVKDTEDNVIWQGTPPPFGYQKPLNPEEKIPMTLNLDFITGEIKEFKVQTILLRVLDSNPNKSGGVVQDTKELSLKLGGENGK
ncbi:hypothetical protein GHK52_01820 [Lactococcus garvieae]|nr:hypothetical protein [Lactococcus garvieae]